ncbi:MAG TPA: ATP-binding protein [Pyrinomonadaceae bacterium]|jgi:two-component system NtrC family sensor kinase|nr:ATP-binding protein [Pyrinomonadaceae bacterium]
MGDQAEGFSATERVMNLSDQASADASLSRQQHSESAATLQTVVEMVRRIMRADTTSVASFSLADKMVIWRAMSGFRSSGITAETEIRMPLRAKFYKDGALTKELMLVTGIGTSDELPSQDFPLHSQEGVLDLALAPLKARGETLGALVVGYRSAHNFTEEERQLLEDLSEMAATVLDNARLIETVSAGKKIWEQTFDAIPDGIIVHDHLMQIVRCNAHAAEMMNLTPAETIGLSCADAFARLFGERAAAYHMGQSTGTASSFELQAEDGRRYLVSVAPLDQPGTPGGSVITWSDVTELSEMQEQLSRSRRLATVGQLAAGVAHEINNPLAAITTCAEATLRDMRSSADTTALAETREWNFYLEEIIRQALRCKAITRGLLDLSRQRRAHRTTCDINALVVQSARLAQQRAASETVKVVVELDENVGEVATDAGMVRQVLDNLLSNALDAVGQEGQVTVQTMREGERVAIEIADTGHGIAPELLVRIFDPFFTTKDPGKGSGLGLAICYTLAEALGGALTVESKQNAGSRFRLWLPRRAPEKEG